MKGTRSKPAIVLAVAMAIFSLAAWSSLAQAYTYTFNDMYYIGSKADYQAVFGSGSNIGPGYQNSSKPYGIYQNQGAYPALGWTTYANKTGSYGDIGIEYMQNSPNGINMDGILLSGWTSTASSQGISKMQVGNVYNDANPNTGGTLRFYSLTDISGISNYTTFTFDSFDLKGAAGETVTFEGVNSGGTIVDTATVTLTGAFKTFTEDWTNLSYVQIVGTSGTGATGDVSMDNIRVNEAFADPTPTPEPATMLLMGVGTLGAAFLKRRKSKAAV